MSARPGLGAPGAPASIDAESVDALGDKDKIEEAAPAEAEAGNETGNDVVSGEKKTGVVKKWNDDKGYGFIGPDDSSKDVFVHGTTIKQENIRNLVEGEKVEFIVNVEPDGRLKASEVTGPNGGLLRGKWEESDDVKTGTVARWRGDKGFGFITPDEGDKDIFAHVNDCGVTLTEGTKVEYTEQVGDDGRIKAVKVYGEGGRPLQEPQNAVTGGPMRVAAMTRPVAGYQQMMVRPGMAPYGVVMQQPYGMYGRAMPRPYGRPY